MEVENIAIHTDKRLIVIVIDKEFPANLNTNNIKVQEHRFQKLAYHS